MELGTVETRARSDFTKESAIKHKIGDFFASSATEFYFKHLPADNANQFYDAIYFAIADDSSSRADQAMHLIAGMFNEGFRLSQTKDRLYGLYPPVGQGPGFELNPGRVLDELALSGAEVLDKPKNTNKFSKFQVWFRNIENSIIC